MTDADLLPCPFCGKPAKFFHDTSSDYERNSNWVVNCSDANCWGEGGHAKSKDDAAAMWNKRSPTVWQYYTREEINEMGDCLISIMHPRAIYDADQLQMANTVINQTKVNAKTAWDILERNVIPDDGNE